MPACHCQEAGTFASYWNVTIAGTRTWAQALAKRLELAVAQVLRVAIGGLPGIENTVFPSGRS